VDVVQVFELALALFGLLLNGDRTGGGEVHAKSAGDERSEIDVDEQAGLRAGSHVESAVDSGRERAGSRLDFANRAIGATGESCAGIVHERQLRIGKGQVEARVAGGGNVGGAEERGFRFKLLDFDTNRALSCEQVGVTRIERRAGERDLKRNDGDARGRASVIETLT